MDSAEVADMAKHGFIVNEKVVPPACSQRLKTTRPG